MTETERLAALLPKVLPIPMVNVYRGTDLDEVFAVIAARLLTAGVTLAPTPPDALREVLREALGHARLELMQDVDPDAIIVGIDAALAAVQCHHTNLANDGRFCLDCRVTLAPTPPDALDATLVITVCPHSVDTRFTTCLRCEKDVAPTPPDAQPTPPDGGCWKCGTPNGDQIRWLLNDLGHKGSGCAPTPPDALREAAQAVVDAIDGAADYEVTNPVLDAADVLRAALEAEHD